MLNTTFRAIMCGIIVVGRIIIIQRDCSWGCQNNSSSFLILMCFKLSIFITNYIFGEMAVETF